MREGIRRLTVAIWVLGWVWIGGVVLIGLMSDEFQDATWAERLLVGALLLAPGYAALGIAWLLDGFAKPDSPQPRQVNDPENMDRN